MLSNLVGCSSLLTVQSARNKARLYLNQRFLSLKVEKLSCLLFCQTTADLFLLHGINTNLKFINQIMVYQLNN